jgi:lysophospholipase L1-like esterase
MLEKRTFKLNKILHMNTIKLGLSIYLALFLIEISHAQDWPNLKRYQIENAALTPPKSGENRIVFMGNSITDSWSTMRPEFFAGKPYVNRGISGQTTPQMLVRFRQDVIDLHPSVVVILAGINDIAQNTGPSTIKMISDNIISMAELAVANNITVVLCSVLPAFDFPWKKGLEPAEKVIKLNAVLKSYAKKHDLTYIDYFSAMVNDVNGLKDELGYDGIHPNAAGYSIMESIFEKEISNVLMKKNNFEKKHSQRIQLEFFQH